MTATITVGMTHVQLHFKLQPLIGFIQIGVQETNTLNIICLLANLHKLASFFTFKMTFDLIP